MATNNVCLYSFENRKHIDTINGFVCCCEKLTFIDLRKTQQYIATNNGKSYSYEKMTNMRSIISRRTRIQTKVYFGVVWFYNETNDIAQVPGKHIHIKTRNVDIQKLKLYSYEKRKTYSYEQIKIYSHETMIFIWLGEKGNYIATKYTITNNYISTKIVLLYSHEKRVLYNYETRKFV